MKLRYLLGIVLSGMYLFFSLIVLLFAVLEITNLYLIVFASLINMPGLAIREDIFYVINILLYFGVGFLIGFIIEKIKKKNTK